MLTPTSAPNDPLFFADAALLPLSQSPGGGSGAGESAVAPGAEIAGFSALLTTCLGSVELAQRGATGLPKGRIGIMVTSDDNATIVGALPDGEAVADETLSPEEAIAAGWTFLPFALPPAAPVPPTGEPATAAPRDVNESTAAGTGRGPDTYTRGDLPQAKATMNRGTTDLPPALASEDVDSTALLDFDHGISPVALQGTEVQASLGGGEQANSESGPTPDSVVVGASRRLHYRNTSGVTVYRAFQDSVSSVDTPSPVSAQFAGHVSSESRQRSSDGALSRNNESQVTDATILKNSIGAVGIEPANASPRMPVEISAMLPTAADLPPVVAPSPLEASVAPAAVSVVEKVLDAAEVLAQTDRASVQLQFDLGEAGPLTVRVSLRDGAVHAVFRSDSTDVRETLAAAWQRFSPDASGALLPPAEPEFLPLRATAPASPAATDSSLQAQTDAHSGGRQQSAAQTVLEFVPPTHRRTAADAAAVSRERDETPRVAGGSLHLSAVA